MSYKDISKILLGRLRPFLDKLISPYQVVRTQKMVFENSILEKKILNTYEKKQGICALIGIKIDMNKAYNKIE